jgi:hypothetical protein
MRVWVWLPLLLVLTACMSDSANTSKLTLRNTVWEHVNVQVVVSKSSDCNANGPDAVSSQNFVMRIDQLKTIVAPPETNICWRHDRYPNNPHPGEWSGWSRAIPFPGNETTTDL